MQNNSTSGLALLLTLIAMLAFGYCSFLGLDYGLKGMWFLSFVITVAAVGLLVYFMFTMINSKKIRNRREGKHREAIAGLVVATILMFGSIPFTKFLEIYHMRNELNSSVRNAVTVISEIDSTYIAYAKDRIKNVKKRTVRESLERRLLPENIEKTVEKRREWLGTIRQPNIWNIYTATNIHHLLVAAETWADEYTEMSRTIYEGEETQPFTHERSKEVIATFHSLFTEFHKPSFQSVLATLLCALCILMCYLLTRRVKTGA